MLVFRAYSKAYGKALVMYSGVVTANKVYYTFRYITGSYPFTWT